jgi:hypothetical protein
MCKKCQSLKPEYVRQPLQKQEFFEHSASDGTSAIGALKTIGVLALIVGLGLATFTHFDNLGKDVPYSNFLVGIMAFQGIAVFGLFFGLGVLIENVVAMRKNTEHLAGIRANTTQAQQANWPA